MLWNRLANVANGVTQKFAGEPIQFKRGEVLTDLLGVFDTQWVEVNGVSAQALTCEVLLSALPSMPIKTDTIIRGDKEYKITPPQQNGDGKVVLLILKEM